MVLEIDKTDDIKEIISIPALVYVPAGLNYKIETKINPDSDFNEGKYTGKLILKNDDYLIGIDVEIDVDKDSIAEKKDYDKIKPKETEEDADLTEFEFNFSSVEPPASVEKSDKGKIIIFIIILAVLAIAYYLSKKKVVDRKSFGEMLKDVERKR